MRGLVLVAALAGAVVACGRERPADSEAGLAADSTRFGDDRAREGDTSRTVPDVALLEQLVDEYEGLDVVMDELAGPSSPKSIQGKAWKADRHEDTAKGRLLDLLLTEFGERYHPRTPAGASGRTDSIASLPREAGRRALTALVIDHHRRVAGQISAGLPGVASPRVRAALTELHASLTSEIARLGGPPPRAL
jgi:hypothetical protein